MVAAQTLIKRAALLIPLLFALWLLTDNDTRETQHRHHLAVITALQRHPPSRRVYRSLLEVNLLLWGVAFSLFVWSRTVGSRIVGLLLFQPVDPPTEMTRTLRSQGAYDRVVRQDNTPAAPDDEDTNEEATEEPVIQARAETIATEESTWDADDASDGSIAPLMAEPEPPRPYQVASAALDLLLVIIISLFLFTISSAEGGTYVDGLDNNSVAEIVGHIAAPIFPLILFLGGALFIVCPWRKRRVFWKVIALTVGAPWTPVTFRDGFVGDVLTSSVRPLQDVSFTVFYILSGLQGWWSQSYDLDDADAPLEKNWLLHTVILPMCTASPLWWRFSQNLRQCYDAKKRWPYLGNALKYFLAAQVAMFGLYHPYLKQNVFWLASYVGATLYQVWWDVFMDWNLFEVDSGSLRLRKNRIYTSKWMYLSIFFINFILRFCWTLSLLPHQYLTSSGLLSKTFDGDLTSILNPALASAEIVRRTLWGLLRLENEALKLAKENPSMARTWSDAFSDEDDDTDEDIELTDMTVKNDAPSRPTPSVSGMLVSADMGMMNDVHILVELSFYSIVFAGLSLIAGVHRTTL